MTGGPEPLGPPDVVGTGGDAPRRPGRWGRWGRWGLAGLLLSAGAALLLARGGPVLGPRPPVAAPTAVASGRAAPVRQAVPTLYVSSCTPDVLYRVGEGGALARLSGTPAAGSAARGGGPVPAGPVTCPDGLLFGPAGAGRVVGADAAHLRVVADGGVVQTLDGRVADPRRALGLRALLVSPDAVAVAADGTVYVGSATSSRVRRLDPSGRLVPLRGAAGPPLPGDDPARGALLAVTPDLSVLFADGSTNHVFRVDPGGRVSVAAGTGAAGTTGDGGPATQAGLDDPRSVALDLAGRFYVSEGAGRRVRRVDPDGTISTVAGASGATAAPGRSGDGGPAVRAAFSYPGDLATDPAGDVYVVDLTAAAVRRITPDGRIDTLGT